VRVLLEMLDDPNADIRFWSCFALGNIGERSAVRKLHVLSKNDMGKCAGWWSVRVEAADAIRVIQGAEWPSRIAKGKGHN
jgi:HEAT repeat protein